MSRRPNRQTDRAETWETAVIELHFTFHTDQRKRFQHGDLVTEWSKRYANLFDEQDIALARSQPNYHFFEWLSAVLLYESTGYLSLLENYSAKRHGSKLEKFVEVAPREVSESIIADPSGIPDLFCYRAVERDWMFFEVKGGKDRIRSNQEKRIRDLEQLCGKPVGVINLKELSG